MPPPSTSERRLKSVFPPGFDSVPSASSMLTGCYVHSTDQLSAALIDNYNPMTPSDSIIVKSAWFGKQTASPMHEFILIQVEDKRDRERQDEGLINYLVLDRNVIGKTKSGGSFKHSWTSLRGGKATDNFRVAYDGDMQKLVDDCKLDPHRLIEHLRFPPESDKPLLLYELVSLAYVVSQRNPTYNAVKLNCYFFAGLIWDCMCELRPDAVLRKPLDKERGKHNWMRCVIDRAQVEDTCVRAQERILWAKSKIEEEKAQLERWVETLAKKVAVSDD